MGKVLRWLAWTACGVLLLAMAVYSIARLRGPADEERAALALLQESPKPPGRNAFAALWLLPHDVPEARLADVLAEDVRRFSRTSAPGTNAELAESFTSIAEERYPATREPERSLYCKWREPDCLARVRADRSAYSRLLDADAALLARVDALSGYGHVRSAFPPRLDAPIPAYSALAYPLTRHALAFAEGNAGEALNGVCRDLSTARMLIGHGDNLVSSMIGATMLQGNAALFADMLAELPAGHPVPAACKAALAPPRPDEFSACNAMRGEARFAFGAMRDLAAAELSIGSTWQDRLRPVLFDDEKTIARMAPRYAWYCGDEARAAITADLPTRAPPPRGVNLACAHNIIGCILADVGAPTMDDYQHRLQDAGMRLKATSTLLWLRDGAANDPLAERLARRPQALRSPRRDLRVSEDGASLSIDLFDTRFGPRWQVPLPASRVGAAGD